MNYELKQTAIRVLSQLNQLKTELDLRARPPKKGDLVNIIVKPYHRQIHVQGIIKRVLTKKRYHTRGHKVELENGTIGRIVTNMI